MQADDTDLICNWRVVLPPPEKTGEERDQYIEEREYGDDDRSQPRENVVEWSIDVFAHYFTVVNEPQHCKQKRPLLSPEDGGCRW